MGNSNSVCFSLLSIIYALILSFRSSKAQMVPAVYLFGDSLVDVGNNNYLTLSIAKANHRHCGIDFPTHKPTGGFTNGKNAADLLAEKLGAGIFDGTDERYVQDMHFDVAALSKPSLWREASCIVNEEVFRAFWRGNLVTITHRLPYSAINFYAYEGFDDILE